MERNYNNDLKIFQKELGKIEFQFPYFRNRGLKTQGVLLIKEILNTMI